MNKDELVLIYQMGKVGSTSLYRSLLRIYPDQVYHAHFLSEKTLDYFETHIRNTHDPFYVSEFNKYFSKMKADRDLGRCLSVLAFNKKWKVITALRDPIARNISSYFQSVERRFCNLFERWGKDIDVGIIINDFFKNFDHTLPLRWFDEEIKEIFGIDVLEGDFLLGEGYKILRKNNAEVLIFKLEKMNSCYRGALKEFLGENIELQNFNESSNKAYMNIYKEFKDKIVFSKKYVDMIYNSDLIRHFYTPEEIGAFKNKWM